MISRTDSRSMKRRRIPRAEVVIQVRMLMSQRGRESVSLVHAGDAQSHSVVLRFGSCSPRAETSGPGRCPGMLGPVRMEAARWWSMRNREQVFHGLGGLSLASFFVQTFKPVFEGCFGCRELGWLNARQQVQLMSTFIYTSYHARANLWRCLGGHARPRCGAKKQLQRERSLDVVRIQESRAQPSGMQLGRSAGLKISSEAGCSVDD